MTSREKTLIDVTMTDIQRENIVQSNDLPNANNVHLFRGKLGKFKKDYHVNGDEKASEIINVLKNS